MAKVNTTSSKPKQSIRPGLTRESRENQLIDLAISLVEQRLIDGTASSQETTHFLKLASTKAKYEQKILEKQAELIEAKTAQIRSSESSEKLVKEAIAAFKLYSGHGDDDENSDVF